MLFHVQIPFLNYSNINIISYMSMQITNIKYPPTVMNTILQNETTFCDKVWNFTLVKKELSNLIGLLAETIPFKVVEMS
jgi:hypothetical protein